MTIAADGSLVSTTEMGWRLLAGSGCMVVVWWTNAGLLHLSIARRVGGSFPDPLETSGIATPVPAVSFLHDDG